MAAKRGKSQAKRNGGTSGGMSGWAWLVIGLALGVGVFLIAPKFLGRDGTGFFRATPAAGTQPAAMDGISDAEPIVGDGETPATAAEPAPKTQDYDFYTLLSGEEKPLSDAELAQRTRAEEAAARQAAATPTPPVDPAANPDAAVPQAIDTPMPPKPSPTETAAANPPPTPPKPVAIDTAPRDDARYLLQAGAFAASGDAEAMKAKIAFLGLSARVESAQIKDKTVYRVRMGPYGTATELAEAKRKLSGGGLSAMAIKTE